MVINVCYLVWWLLTMVINFCYLVWWLLTMVIVSPVSRVVGPLPKHPPGKRNDHISTYPPTSRHF